MAELLHGLQEGWFTPMKPLSQGMSSKWNAQEHTRA